MSDKSAFWHDGYREGFDGKPCAPPPRVCGSDIPSQEYIDGYSAGEFDRANADREEWESQNEARPHSR